MSKKFTAKVDNMNESDIWGGHVLIPEDIVEHFLSKKIKRVICNINNAHEFHCAIMPKGGGLYFININTEIRKKLRLNIGTEIQVEMKEDTSKYGIHLPEEMEELLKIDDEGSAVFHSLTPGKQRSLLHIVGKPKSSDIRLKKALVVIDYLKAVNGKLDFKELNQAFKDSNQR